MTSRLVVSYTGTAASTDALRALVAASRGEVVTLTLDLGQARGGELEQVRETALAAGAARAHVIDARDEFARAHVLPALQAGVAPGGWLPLVRSLGRPLVAARLAEIAAIEEARVHGDAAGHDVDASILGRVVTDGRYRLTQDPAQAPREAALVAVTCEEGVPVAINDVPLPLTELIESLAVIAGPHGVGRVDGVEAPAAVVLAAALRGRPRGVVRVKLLAGTCEQVPELVTHS